MLHGLHCEAEDASAAFEDPLDLEAELGAVMGDAIDVGGLDGCDKDSLPSGDALAHHLRHDLHDGEPVVLEPSHLDELVAMWRSTICYSLGMLNQRVTQLSDLKYNMQRPLLSPGEARLGPTLSMIDHHGEPSLIFWSRQYDNWGQVIKLDRLDKPQ